MKITTPLVPRFNQTNRHTEGANVSSRVIQPSYFTLGLTDIEADMQIYTVFSELSLVNRL